MDTPIIRIEINQARLKADLPSIIARLLAAQTKYQHVERDGKIIKPTKRIPYQALYDATIPPGKLNKKGEPCIVGSHEAARLLERLLDLTPRAADREGWVYKAAGEWWEDMRFSRYHLDTARKHLAGLVVTANKYCKRAHRTVMHYQVCLVELVRRLGKALGVAVEIVFDEKPQTDEKANDGKPQTLFAGKPQRPNVENQQTGGGAFDGNQHDRLMETDKGSGTDSFFTSPLTQESDSTVADSTITSSTARVSKYGDDGDFSKTRFRDEILERAGKLWGLLSKDYERVLDELIFQYGGEMMAATMQYGQGLKKKPAHPNWFIPVMERNQVLGKSPADIRGLVEDKEPAARRFEIYGSGQEADSPIPHSPPSPPAVICEASPEEQEKWSASYHQLELQLDKPSFDTFLRGAALLRVERAEGGNEPIYVIRVRNEHVREACQYRLYRNIRRVLGDVLGGPVELRFESAEVSAPVAPEPELETT